MKDSPHNDPLFEFFKNDRDRIPEAPSSELNEILTRVDRKKWIRLMPAAAALLLLVIPFYQTTEIADVTEIIELEYSDVHEDDFGEEWIALVDDK